MIHKETKREHSKEKGQKTRISMLADSECKWGVEKCHHQSHRIEIIHCAPNHLYRNRKKQFRRTILHING